MKMKFKLLGCLFFITVIAVSGCDGASATRATTLTTATAPISRSSDLTPSYLAANGYASPDLPRITSQELKQRLDNGEAVTIVDVRARVGFKLFSIKGAINIPNDPEEESITGLRSLPKDRLIVFYCT
jgi:hypothetical protein